MDSMLGQSAHQVGQVLRRARLEAHPRAQRWGDMRRNFIQVIPTLSVIANHGCQCEWSMVNPGQRLSVRAGVQLAESHCFEKADRFVSLDVALRHDKVGVAVGARELSGGCEQCEQAGQAMAARAEMGGDTRRPDAGRTQTECRFFDKVANRRHPLLAHRPDLRRWAIAHPLTQWRAGLERITQGQKSWAR
jgi:hypothetical protein